MLLRDQNTVYNNRLSPEIAKYLTENFNASKEAIDFLGQTAASTNDYMAFKDWQSAVSWATEKTKEFDALDYLKEPDRMEIEDDQMEQEIEHDYSVKSSEYYQMPLENVGDMGERLAKKWLNQLGVKVTSEQNNSGHGLDASFEITQEQILNLPNHLREIFSNAVPRGQTTTRSGRKSGKEIEPTNQTFLVILEIKANNAQMSKAQKDPDAYVYKQSKKGFAVEMREKMDKQLLEIFYEVRVDMQDRSRKDVNLTFTPNEKEKQAMKGSVINYDTEEQLSYITPKEIGDIGEKWTREQLLLHGYTEVTSLQKEGGQGVDVVGLDPKGKFTFFEVKTHLGSGKKPSLTQREKKQSGFVSEIVLNIMNRSDGYENVDYKVYEQVREIYMQATYEDQERREEEKLPMIGMDAVDIDGVIKEYLAKRARYFIVNVDLPNLGDLGQISGKFLNWNPPKN
jgi:Holliday junction resolvase-like predicted endonuclease